MKQTLPKPTGAFVGASWTALLVGALAFLAGLWNGTMPSYEKGYYFTVLMFGLYAAVSLQKAVRDRMEGIPVTGLYFGLSWFAVGLSILLLTVGVWNSDLSSSEKGFYAMSYLLSLFAAVAVQKNVRDMALFRDESKPAEQESESSS
ncbi:MAG: hypothetical protein IPH39_19905 [Sulfuritalea sp.]|nr:hypothetical protein [Sulfuritalea sp.]MBK9352275.1 hypothetical protein [Sulfuritalea sp.]